ncbi:hypothetical protein CERSUDRAFT_113765 [Gelatoporia subvermispora B]|uniref:DUF6534 domain-containing protein n=1 Tax=Ceriporiopsis subvermispora (strain B) TaxID=914234 RepID=M2RIF1_CERS8|nr:hypothetical protein CERSUDRAFT_113765 [Gelatoporia subvermispora B]
MPSFVDLNSTFGAAYIGAMVTLVLYGITSLQSYLYYAYYPKDDRSLKFTVGLPSTRLRSLLTSQAYQVAAVWILDTLHVALVCYSMYYYLILNYANPLALFHGIWSLDVSVLINTLIACIVQTFFTQRVYQLTPQPWKYPVTGLIGATVLAHFALGLETTVKFFQIQDFSRLSEISFSAALPFAIMAVLSDVAVAAALCILLHNSRTVYHSTNHILYKLMVFAINRCVLTSLVAIVELVVFLKLQHTLWFLAIDFIIGKLYANSLLATLNTRRIISGKGLEESRGSGMTATSTSFRVGSGQATTDSSRPGDTEEGPIIDLADLGVAKEYGNLGTNAPHRTANVHVRHSLAHD